MEIATFTLENWWREHYFDAQIVLCVSGVEEFSLGELRELVQISQAEMDAIVFKDSPSCGSPGLRKAIARRWGNGDPERVMATHGSSEAIFLIMNALLHAGDEVVVLTPCYQPLLSIPEAIGCQVKQWRLRPEQEFAPDLEEFKRLLTPDTRMVVVNFPNNPTGATLTKEQLDELIEATAAVDAYLLWDSAFIELTYDSPPLPDPGTVYNRTITLGTLTKAYGLSGLRVGWCLASPDVLERCVHLRDYVTLNLSPLIELIAQRVVEQVDLLLSKRLQQARVNRELLIRWIEEHKEHVRWIRPQGGVSAFLSFPGIPDIEAFCHHLARETGVFLLPGSCFGYPGYVRLGFGGPTDELNEGLSRLSRQLASDLSGLAELN